VAGTAHEHLYTNRYINIPLDCFFERFVVGIGISKRDFTPKNAPEEQENKAGRKGRAKPREQGCTYSARKTPHGSRRERERA
jgi:hypothetical protein